jgi:hypothetical protein
VVHKNDAESVSIFYIESLYIVGFLVKTYGKDAFKDLCRIKNIPLHFPAIKFPLSFL